MIGGLTQRVRDNICGFSKRKAFSASSIAKAIGEPNAAMVQQVFADLVDRGELLRKGPGKYVYAGSSKRGRKSPVTERVLRSMHLANSFTARDIAILAEATKNFVYKIIRALAAKGDLIDVGTSDNLSGQAERRFKVKNRDAFYLEHLIREHRAK